MPLSKRESLFSIGAAAVTALRPDLSGLYACPLCLRLFPIEALKARILTLEHAPPRARGGASITLTCKACNSTAGHTVDAALDGREHLFSLIRTTKGEGGSFTGPVTVEIAGTKTNALMSVTDNKIHLEVRRSMNHPDAFAAQADSVLAGRAHSSPHTPPLKVLAKVPFKFQRARVADLRAAFLVAFAVFGYRYICHPLLSQVREQLGAPDQTLTEGAWGLAGREFSEDPFLFLQWKPFPALLVRMRSMLVVLPWLEGPEPFFPHVRAHLYGRTTAATGDDMIWPNTMHMALDFPEP